MDYNQSTYPLFVSGHAYTMSSDVLTKLVHTAERIKTKILFPLEDIYFTGILASLNNIFVSSYSKYSGRFIFNGMKLPIACVRHPVSVHGLENTTQFFLQYMNCTKNSTV